MRVNRFRLGCFVITLWWFISTFLGVFLAPNASIQLGEYGNVGVIDNSIHYTDLNIYSKFFYTVGDFNCHQKSSRSFIINGNQLPFCSRDVGIFAGSLICFATLILIRINLQKWLVVYAFLPISIDASMQMFTIYESINPIRFATGFLAGFVLAYIFVMFVEQYSYLSNVKKMIKHSRAVP
jgi:uncharacterized membrane protein